MAVKITKEDIENIKSGLDNVQEHIQDATVSEILETLQYLCITDYIVDQIKFLREKK